MKKNKASLLFSLLFIPILSMTFLFPEIRGDVSRNPTTAELRLKWFRQHLKMKEESLFKNLKWKSIGPIAMSGRITDIAVPKGGKFTIYASAASGGLWKTVNNGTTWQPLWDSQASNSVGDIAVSDSNPEIIWVGAGENNSSRSSYSGTGVYKSLDGGASWQHMGLSDTHHIGRIVIHYQNPGIVYVAALGHLYTRNEERGIFKTEDGGKTWEKILYIDDTTGFIDLVMDPLNSNILYAASWERIREAWDMVEYGKGSGIYKTKDAGKTWKRLDQGFPQGEFIGRIGIDVSASNPDVLYALVDNHNARKDEKPEGLDPYGIKKLEKVIIGAEVYRSGDQGESWQKVNEDDLKNLYSTYGYYFGEIRVSPDNEDEIYVLGVPLLHSINGGKTYENLSYKGLHGDHQALWIDPENPDHLIDGNDGGLNFSYDRGRTWVDMEMPLGQFYFITVDMEEPFNIYGSIQDNGCWYGPVTADPDESEHWKPFPGGEASYVAIDPSDWNTLYSEGYYGRLMRVDRRSWSTKNIRPKPQKEESPLRCNWLTPFIISPHNPWTLYFGSQRLYKSLDQGEHWQAVSPDLTDNDPEKIQGDVPFCTITSISESPLKPGLIYVGTDDGNVQVTKNGGVTWKKIMEGLPPERWVSRIAASRYKESTVYVSLNGYRDDDFAAYLFKSDDYGVTWEDIGQGLPGGPINTIKEDPKKEGILYVGSDLGVYVSLDNGKNWESLCSNLPTTFVHDLVVHPRENILVMGTHGRSVFVMDAQAIQELDEEIQAKDLYLFSIKPVFRNRSRGARSEAVIHFYLKQDDSVSVHISDRKGKKIKSFQIKGSRGINTVAWDLALESDDLWPRYASAGKYKVSITAGKKKAEEFLEIKPLR
jgi:hypothetical protein